MLSLEFPHPIFESLPVGEFCMSSADFFKINLFKKLFREYHQSVKRFESRSGSTFCGALSGSKFFAKVLSICHLKAKN